MGVFSNLAAEIVATDAEFHKAAHEAQTLAFRPWAEQGQFRADREKIDFGVWRFLKPIYDAVPMNCSDLRPKERQGFELVIMKAAQCGASTMLMLWSLWMALRRTMRLAYFMPTQDLTIEFSQDRFIRMVRDNPAIHRLMGDPGSFAIVDEKDRSPDEGSAATRRILESIIYFTYLLGTVTTEGKPLDALGYDEVQKMSTKDIERANERVSASQIKAKMLVSTAYYEDADIHLFYKASDQRRYHTHCDCDDGLIMQDYFDPREGPILIDRATSNTVGVEAGEYFYFCPKCKAIVLDPQRPTKDRAEGGFLPHKPENFCIRPDGWPEGRIGFSWAQCLSPRISARDLFFAWKDRIDTQNYFNRKVGIPYSDPDTIPVTEAQLVAAEARGLSHGAQWGPPKRRGEGIEACYMGIDQMGHDNRIVIVGKTNDPEVPMRLLHLEIVLEADPWERAAELMKEYRVRYCAVEGLPNFNQAHAFAKEFDGRVFVVSYSDHANEILTWGDRPKDPVLVRQTDEELRARYTASVDQYKMMSWALSLWGEKAHYVETPDRRRLTQHVRGTPGPTAIALLFGEHLRHIALVVEKVAGREDEHKFRRAVKKLGAEDPHFAFAWMLVCIAWARAYGTDQMLLPDDPPTNVERDEPIATDVAAQVQQTIGHMMQPPTELTSLEGPAGALVAACGNCVNFDAGRKFCKEKRLNVLPTMPPCGGYVPIADEDEDDWEGDE